MRRLWDKGGDADELVMRYTVGDDYLWDERLVAHDIRASVAHVEMLISCGHLVPAIGERLIIGLEEIAEEHVAGTWTIQSEEEDCHTAIENRLTSMMGADAGWVHLGRSRNDQVLTAVRLYLIDASGLLATAAESVATAVRGIAVGQGEVAMPGYTHMQRAMPSSVGLWAEAFVSELKDDATGLLNSSRRARLNPLGSAAGYGTPGIELDRDVTTRALGFNRTQEPVTSAQLSRGKAEATLAFECALLMQDLGRLAADLCLFATAEFGFLTLPAKFTTGSSIMPQKRNPDVFELVRGHSAQATTALQAILAVTAKQTSGYHRDLQLIKPALFGLIDRTLDAANVMAHVVPEVRFRPERTRAAMDTSLDATEDAYRLVKAENIPFREAYRRVGEKFKDPE